MPELPDITVYVEALGARVVGQTGDRFPEKVTAFRPEMAVHGRYGQPCPACGTAVQRLVYAENESNYCPTCQTGGRLLADRALSRLLRADWPKTVDELEQRRSRGRDATRRDSSDVLPYQDVEPEPRGIFPCVRSGFPEPVAPRF